MVIVEHLLEKFKIIDTNRRKRKNIKSEFEVVIVEHLADLIYLLRSQVVFVNVY